MYGAEVVNQPYFNEINNILCTWHRTMQMLMLQRVCKHSLNKYTNPFGLDVDIHVAKFEYMQTEYGRECNQLRKTCINCNLC